MTYKELKAKFNCELPDYSANYFEGFISEYNRNEPILSASEIDIVAEATRLPNDGRDALIKCVEIMNNSDDAHLCGSFLVYLTVKKRAPWLNYIYTDNLFNVEGLKREQVGWVIVSAQLANTLINKKPPKELNKENTDAFRGYSQNCFDKNGYWGILEWHWNMLCAGGCMFMFGILKIVPGEFGGDFPIITDGKRYVSLVGGEYFIGRNGDLVDSESKSVGKTLFYEDDEKYIGHIVSPRGIVDSKPTEFPKSVWRDYMRRGTHTLEIHIPSKIEYTPENIKESYKSALDFYKDFYPNHHPKAIAGYSWIFAPQLELVMPHDSNILKVNRSMHLLPTTEHYDADCRFLRQGSGLQQRIASECEKGTEFHYTIMYTPIDEVETFGKEV